jgi:hypothetical protein
VVNEWRTQNRKMNSTATIAFLLYPRCSHRSSLAISLTVYGRGDGLEAGESSRAWGVWGVSTSDRSYWMRCHDEQSWLTATRLFSAAKRVWWKPLDAKGDMIVKEKSSGSFCCRRWLTKMQSKDFNLSRYLLSWQEVPLYLSPFTSSFSMNSPPPRPSYTSYPFSLAAHFFGRGGYQYETIVKYFFFFVVSLADSQENSKILLERKEVDHKI